MKEEATSTTQYVYLKNLQKENKRLKKALRKKDKALETIQKMTFDRNVYAYAEKGLKEAGE
jgi:hypothetical protein